MKELVEVIAKALVDDPESVTGKRTHGEEDNYPGSTCCRF